jgi:hypothetical protein
MTDRNGTEFPSGYAELLDPRFPVCQFEECAVSQVVPKFAHCSRSSDGFAEACSGESKRIAMTAKIAMTTAIESTRPRFLGVKSSQ